MEGQEVCIWYLQLLGPPGPAMLSTVTSLWVCPFESKDGLAHLCQWEAEECISQIQDGVYFSRRIGLKRVPGFLVG